ncbi:hypothetical protein GF373_07840, partial [bacterium]|nr:hypothetical protein [bacterium]
MHESGGAKGLNSIEKMKTKIKSIQTRKGEIMRRAGIGLFTSSWSACVFVMVMAALMVSAPLSASAAVTVNPNDWDYVDQTFDFKANGADKALPSVGAILCATDASDLIHKNGKDGAIDASSGAGKLIGKFIKRPIMANLIPDSDAKLFLATVISGVSQTVVGNLGGQSDMYTLNESGQALQDKVAATFDNKLFDSDDTGSIVTQAQSTAGLEPRAVTGAASYASQLAMDELDAATAVVMIWDYPELAVGSDEKSYADDELNAVVTIDADTDNVAESNFVGVEIPGETGPTFSTTDLNKKLRIQTVLDNTSLDLYNQGGGALALYSGTTKNSLFGDDFEFRAEDTIEFNAVIDENAELDGEPDTYFGSGGTDTLDFVIGTTTFKDLKDDFGGSLTTTSQKIQSATALFQFDIMKADGTSMFANMKTGNVDISITRNGGLILEVTGTIKDTLLTFGEYENFEVAFEIGDEFINNASRQELTTLDYDGSSTTAKLKVDTAAPAIVKLDALADESASFDVINYNDDFELTALVDANGEKEFNPEKWLNALALPVARKYNDLDTILQYNGES